MKTDLETIINAGTKALQTEEFDKATALFQTALKTAEAGKDQLMVAVCLDQFGEMYFHQGLFAQAEPYYERAFVIRRKLLTPAHEDIVLSLNNLSSVYFFQGKYWMAKPLCEQLMATYETVLGNDHPEVATCLINLGLIAMAEGKFGQAEKFYRDSYSIRQTALGADNVLTANSLSHLGNVYLEQKRFPEAIDALKKALVVLDKRVGPEHPDLEKVVNKLIEALEASGQSSEAAELYPRLVGLKEIALGPAHAEVASHLEKLARMHFAQGKNEEASRLFQRLLTMKRRAYGDTHPQVADQLTNLAFVIAAQGHSAKVESLFVQAVEIYEKTSIKVDGRIEANIQFLEAIRNLAAFYDSDRRFAKSEKEWQRLVQLLEPEAGKYPDFLLQSYEWLANCLLEENKGQQALPVLRNALQFLQGYEHLPDRKQAEDELRRARFLTQMGQALKQSGQLTDAELFYKDALDKMMKIVGPNHPDLAPTLEGYADLLTRTYREAEAEHILACVRGLSPRT